MAAYKVKRKALVKSCKQYTPSVLFKYLQHDRVYKELFPCCMHLLELRIIFPSSVSCIKKLSLRMKFKLFVKSTLTDIIRFSFGY